MIERSETARLAYENAGREISQSFDIQNSNMALVAGTLAAVLTVLGTGEIFRAKTRLGGVPVLSVTSLMVLTIALPLVVRFFIRSMIAYQNLLRFNALQIAAWRFLTGKSVWEAFALHHEIYIEKWRSPRTLRHLMLENLKYGYFWIFAAAVVPLGWGFYLASWHWGRTVSLLLLGGALAWETKTLGATRTRYFTVPTREECERLDALASTPVGGADDERLREAKRWVIEERGLFVGRRRVVEADDGSD